MSDLVPRLLFGSLDLTEAPYLLEFGSDFGGPENIQTAMAQLLQDGEIVSGDRSSNRELQFSILVEGPDFQAMAEAEAALILEANRPLNTITWDPGDGWGPATVYDTFRATAKLVRIDEMEGARLRRYSLTIPAQPFGRSVSPVTEVLAAAAPAAATVLDTCDAATNWSCVGFSTAGTVAVVTSPKVLGTGSLHFEGDAELYGFNGNTFHYRLTATRTASFTVTEAAPYVRFYASTLAPPSSVTLKADGVAGVRMGTSAAVGQFYQHVFRLPPGTYSALNIGLDYTLTSPNFDGNTSELWVDQIDFINAPVFTSSSRRQRLVQLTMKGSARAPGNLHVGRAAGTGGLGTVIVHASNTDGLTPDLRRWRTDTTGRTVDATAVSGFYELAGNNSAGFPLAIPSIAFTGTYALLVRVRNDSDFSRVPFAARIFAKVAGQQVDKRVTIKDSFVDGWQTVILGNLHLPDVAVASGSARTMTMNIWATLAVGDKMRIDEAWLLPVDGNTLMVEMPTESDLWVDAPSVDRPLGAVWVNTSNDRAGAYHPGANLIRDARFRFTPPVTSFFVVSAGVNDPTLEVSYHPHWHTNAAS